MSANLLSSDAGVAFRPEDATQVGFILSPHNHHLLQRTKPKTTRTTLAAADSPPLAATTRESKAAVKSDDGDMLDLPTRRPPTKSQHPPTQEQLRGAAAITSWTTERNK
jgi:hypothetical protein